MFEIFTKLFRFLALQFLQIFKNIHRIYAGKPITYSRRLPAELIDEIFKFCTHKKCAELSDNSKTKSQWLSSLAKYRAERFPKGDSHRRIYAPQIWLDWLLWPLGLDFKLNYAPNNWLDWLLHLHPFRFFTENLQLWANIEERMANLDEQIANLDERIRRLQKRIQHKKRLRKQRNRKQWNRRIGGCKWLRRRLNLNSSR